MLFYPEHDAYSNNNNVLVHVTRVDFYNNYFRLLNRLGDAGSVREGGGVIIPRPSPV